MNEWWKKLKLLMDGETFEDQHGKLIDPERVTMAEDDAGTQRISDELDELKREITNSHWLNVHFRAFNIANEAWAKHAIACKRNRRMGLDVDHQKGPEAGPLRGSVDSSVLDAGEEFDRIKNKLRGSTIRDLYARTYPEPLPTGWGIDRTPNATNVSVMTTAELDGVNVTKSISGIRFDQVAEAFKLMEGK